MTKKTKCCGVLEKYVKYALYRQQPIRSDLNPLSKLRAAETTTTKRHIYFFFYIEIELCRNFKFKNVFDIELICYLWIPVDKF